MKTIAAIDIGTNTVLLLVAGISSDNSITTLEYEQRVPRLGKGVDAHRRLHPDSMARVVAVLHEYALLITPHHPSSIIVFGTSAVRDAANRQELADRIQHETGWTLEVLSGADEAWWTYKGAVSGFPELQEAMVIDIGGGSTECVYGTQEAILHAISVDIGSVRLTERRLAHNPPLDNEVEAVRTDIRSALATIPWQPARGSSLVAVAGTATTLALLDQGLSTFSREAVNGYRLHRTGVAFLANRLPALSSQEILALGEFMQGRSDIIAAGVLLLDELMEKFHYEEVLVSERGVRYGIVLREVER